MTSQAPPERAGGPDGPGLRLRYAAVSDVGRVRKDNQDSAYAGPQLLVVADGVGGSNRGDVASSTAVEQLRALDADQTDAQAAVADGIDQSHRRIAELVAQHPELEGTSTTVTAAVFDGAHLWFGHVGDSRAYLLRDGRLSQVTTDHTFVQTLIDEGRITEAESRVHPHRNLILRAVDGVHESEPDLFTIDLRPGDRVLLCSDGASGVLDSDALTELLGAGTVEAAAQTLVRSALDAGSTDNVTVVVADVVDTANDDPDETQAMQVAPIVVGAAAERRKGIGRRRSRRADTGELDAVVVDPAEDELPPARPVDAEQVRYAPRPPRRLAWLRRLVVLLVALVLVYAAGSGAYAWSQRQYYVAPADGKVAIYQGVEASVPILRLHRVHSVSDTAVADLPSYNRGQVRDGMTTRNLASAEALVRRLDRAATCQDEATSPSTSPTPTATASGSPSGTATATASPRGGRTVSPTKPARSGSARSASPSGSASSPASPSATSTSGSGSTDCTDGTDGG